MKKTLVLLLVSFYSISIQAEDVWMYSFEQAKKTALATNKLILVDFWATWCGPCNKMDAETWNDKEVKNLMNNFVPLKIDIDNNKELALKYDVRGIPNIIIIDANGVVLYSETGYKSKQKILNLLTKYSVDTSYLQMELVNFFKNSNIIFHTNN